MSKTLLLFLSATISAFMLGATTLLFLDKRYERADLPQPKVSESSPGLMRLDDGTQICWGRLDVHPYLGRGDLRKVSIKFPSPFGTAPTVTLGMQPEFVKDRMAVTWTDFQREVSPSSYAASIIAFYPEAPGLRDFATDDLKVDYIAVGRWK